MIIIPGLVDPKFGPERVQMMAKTVDIPLPLIELMQLHIMVVWARFDYSRRLTGSRIPEANPGSFNGESAKEARKGNSNEPRCQETLLRLSKNVKQFASY